MHLRLGFWEPPNSVNALQHMKYCSDLDIIGFDQSSTPDFMGNSSGCVECMFHIQH